MPPTDAPASTIGPQPVPVARNEEKDEHGNLGPHGRSPDGQMGHGNTRPAFTSSQATDCSDVVSVIDFAGRQKPTLNGLLTVLAPCCERDAPHSRAGSVGAPGIEP